MLNLLEQIRAALDALEPRLDGRVVDVEMPRLFVEGDADALHRVLVAMIGRGVAAYAGTITVRTVKWRGKARLEVTGERAVVDAGAEWPDSVADDVATLRGEVGTDGPGGWLTVPLAGENTAE